ncbi:MAG: N-acetylneuraminate synthase family protein, partial [Lachnospiraceae bacterium]|nr:N-acetylneuraminate synthase family protein [Lachnospiraceae bacterium]
SADYLYDLVDIYKISSSDLSNTPFISYIAAKGKPVYISTGAACLSEIVEAVEILQEHKCPEICIMHCVLSYPCKYEDANLNMIKTLKRIFPDQKIGYSDHTEPDGSMTVLTTAYLFGAEIIEKHFTLDRSLSGNDHYHAGDPDDFRKAVDNFQLIEKIGGHFEKEVLPCEKTSRREARRSLVLTRDVLRGEKVHKEDLTFKRPGTGISPKDMESVIGRVYQRDLAADTVLTWDMI